MKQKKFFQSRILFLMILLIKWLPCDKGVKIIITLKIRHMSAVKTLWWYDLWEDLCAAALGDYRE